MDWVWQSETWMGGWMLPAGSALVALGLTTLAAAAYARWRMHRRTEAKVSGESVDLRDETITTRRPAPVKPSLEGLDEEIARLERGLTELRRRLEAWSPETTSAAGATGATKNGATLRRVRASSGNTPQGSPEVEALRAFVAESR